MIRCSGSSRPACASFRSGRGRSGSASSTGASTARPIRIDADGTLVLPRLAGETLATLLEDPALDESVQRRAIELAVVALAELHRLGFTHGDAMAENVMVDLDAGVAHWFDFETVHDAGRPMAWRRADDVRALLATCLVRTAPERLAETLRLILDVYADDGRDPRLRHELRLGRAAPARLPPRAGAGCPCSDSGRSAGCCDSASASSSPRVPRRGRGPLAPIARHPLA